MQTFPLGDRRPAAALRTIVVTLATAALAPPVSATHRGIARWRPAAQLVSIGETHDVQFSPAEQGMLRLEVHPASLGRLRVRVPIRVR